MTDADFSALLVPVATYFWGEPTKVTDHEVRWGNQGSKVVNVEKGSWKDFESDAGGGLFRLIEAEAGLGDGDKSGCLKFLEQEGFIAKREQHRGQSKPSQPMPPKEQRSLPAPPPNGKKVEAAVYDYTDSDGGLIYQVVRIQVQLPDGTYQPTKDGKGLWKTFLQRRPSGLGDKSMVWGLSAGEFMRKAGENWRKYDEQTFKDYGYAEKRWFDSEVTHSIYRHPAVEIAISENKAVYICEGEKDVHTLEGFGHCATTNSGGAQHWTPELACLFKGADVVVLADNDEAGRDRCEAVAKSLKGIAQRVRVLNLVDHVSDLKPKGDVTDWVEDCAGSAEQFQAIVDGLADWKPKAPRSTMGDIRLSDLSKQSFDHEWLVQDMIELGGTAAFAGFSEAGKSFMMIELAFCIATGRKFWGRDVKQGLVVYQAGEGGSGLKKRIHGYMQDRDIPDADQIPLVLMLEKINLFVSDDDMNKVIERLKAWRDYYQLPVRLFVVDTFNKATRGANEISGLDVGKVIDRMERISEALGCTVMVVDHLSAQGRFRGHGSKTGDMTNVVMVETTDSTDRNGRKIRRMRLEKNKDGEKGTSIGFVLRQVVVGYDDLNRPITTCVVDAPDGDDEELTKKGRLSLNQSFVLRTLCDVISREGVPAPAGVVGCPKNRNVVSFRTFMAELRTKWTYTASEREPEKREGELRRVVAECGKKLQLAGFIDRDNERSIKEGEKGLIWCTGKEDKVFSKPETRAEPLPAVVQAELADMEGMPF